MANTLAMALGTCGSGSSGGCIKSIQRGVYNQPNINEHNNVSSDERVVININSIDPEKSIVILDGDMLDGITLISIASNSITLSTGIADEPHATTISNYKFSWQVIEFN